MNAIAAKQGDSKPATGTCSHCGWHGLDLKKDGTVVAHGSAQDAHFVAKSAPRHVLHAKLVFRERSKPRFFEDDE